MRLSPAAVDLAMRQRGLITTAQLGLPSHVITTLTSHGVLVRVERNVFRLLGAPGGYAHDCQRAVLAIGGLVAVSHGSCARVYGFDQLGEGSIDVTVESSRHTRRTCATIHRRRLPDGDVRIHRGLPLTAPPRLLADLLMERYDTRFLGKLADHLLRKRLMTPRSVVVAMGSMGWHPGCVSLRRLMELHLEGLRVTGRPPDTDWERDIERGLVANGLPAPVRQHPVDLGDHVVFIDLALSAERVALEFDGFEVHSGRGSFDDDRRRADDVTAAGWRVVQLTSAMSEGEVVRRVRRAVEQQRSRLGLDQSSS